MKTEISAAEAKKISSEPKRLMKEILTGIKKEAKMGNNVYIYTEIMMGYDAQAYVCEKLRDLGYTVAVYCDDSEITVIPQKVTHKVKITSIVVEW